MVELARPADVLGLPKLDIKNKLKNAGATVKTKATSASTNIKGIIAEDAAKIADIRGKIKEHLPGFAELPYQPQTPAERRAELHALSTVMKVVSQDYATKTTAARKDIPQNGDFRIQDLIHRADDMAGALQHTGAPMEQVRPYVLLARKLERERNEGIRQQGKPKTGLEKVPRTNGQQKVSTDKRLSSTRARERVATGRIQAEAAKL